MTKQKILLWFTIGQFLNLIQKGQMQQVFISILNEGPTAIKVGLCSRLVCRIMVMISNTLHHLVGWMDADRLPSGHMMGQAIICALTHWGRTMMTAIMKASWYGNAFRVTGCLWRESTFPGGFPSHMANNAGFDNFFDLFLNIRWPQCQWMTSTDWKERKKIKVARRYFIKWKFFFKDQLWEVFFVNRPGAHN